MLCFQPLYDSYTAAHVPPVPEPVLSAMQQFNKRRRVETNTASGFQRMAACRRALEALDRQGWDRSYHQRLFHENFLKACSRIFWKTEKAGQFQKDHQKILQLNGWTHLSQVWSAPSTWPGSISCLTAFRAGNPGVDAPSVRGIPATAWPKESSDEGGCRSSLLEQHMERETFFI